MIRSFPINRNYIWIINIFRMVVFIKNLDILSDNVDDEIKTMLLDDCDPHWLHSKCSKCLIISSEMSIHWIYKRYRFAFHKIPYGKTCNLTKRWHLERRSVYLIEIFSIFQWFSVGLVWYWADPMSCYRCRCHRSNRLTTHLSCWCWQVNLWTPLLPLSMCYS